MPFSYFLSSKTVFIWFSEHILYPCVIFLCSLYINRIKMQQIRNTAIAREYTTINTRRSVKANISPGIRGFVRAKRCLRRKNSLEPVEQPATVTFSSFTHQSYMYLGILCIITFTVLPLTVFIRCTFIDFSTFQVLL